jgi:hypothetical protein
VIVVDTNVLACFLMPYEHSAQAEALYDRDPEWAVPILWRSECRNVLAGYLRRGVLSFEDIVRVNSRVEVVIGADEPVLGPVKGEHLLGERLTPAFGCGDTGDASGEKFTGYVEGWE